MPIHSTSQVCDHGWVHHQHPMKPPGVVMYSEPCPVCNPQGTKQPINQCDGCRRGLPRDNQGIHHGPGPYDLIGCTEYLYIERP